MQTHTQMTRAVALAEQGLSHTKIAAHVGRHRETIGLWLKGLSRYGLSSVLARHRQAKTGPRLARQVPAPIQRRIWELRVRAYECCGQQIAYFLEQEYPLRLSVPKIYEILAEKYVIRSKWRTNQKRGTVPTASRARAVIPMATVTVGHRCAFTGGDSDTTEAAVGLRPALTRDEGAAFVQTAMTRRFAGHGAVLQTDGGPECKGAFATQARSYCERHRRARPYKTHEQAYMERFNRTVRKECLGGERIEPVTARV